MPDPTHNHKEMPPELTEVLARLLADALVADIKQHHDLHLREGAEQVKVTHESSGQASTPAKSALPSHQPKTDPSAKATAVSADCPRQTLPVVSPAVRPFLDALAELAAAEVIKRSRRENRIIEERIDTPHAKGRRPVDDQGQKVLKPKGRLLTIQEAADYLGIARASLAGRGWRVKNRLPAIKVGRAVRFDIKMLDQWIERHRERLPRLSDATDAGNLD